MFLTIHIGERWWCDVCVQEFLCLYKIVLVLIFNYTEILTFTLCLLLISCYLKCFLVNLSFMGNSISHSDFFCSKLTKGLSSKFLFFFVSSISFETVSKGIILIVKQVVMHQYILITLDKLIMRVYHNLTGILLHL